VCLYTLSKSTVTGDSFHLLLQVDIFQTQVGLSVLFYIIVAIIIILFLSNIWKQRKVKLDQKNDDWLNSSQR